MKLYIDESVNPLCVGNELGEMSLSGLDLVRQTTKQVKKIRDNILIAQSRQKSYADTRRKLLKFQGGDYALLRIVTP